MNRFGLELDGGGAPSISRQDSRGAVEALPDHARACFRSHGMKLLRGDGPRGEQAHEDEERAAESYMRSVTEVARYRVRLQVRLAVSAEASPTLRVEQGGEPYAEPDAHAQPDHLGMLRSALNERALRRTQLRVCCVSERIREHL